jgi:hypothetical protein
LSAYWQPAVSADLVQLLRVSPPSALNRHF